MKTIVRDEEVLGGAPRLDGTRIGVMHVYRRYEAGERPEEIAADYDGVTVADVHHALAYAFDNPDVIRELSANDREAIERIRAARGLEPTGRTERT